MSNKRSRPSFSGATGTLPISQFIDDAAVEEAVDEMEEVDDDKVDDDEVDPEQSEPLHRVYCSLD